ncbi:aldo/keto reductase [Novipirellula artificiosorum]|uniref:D-threo-aldose 1-dehydrogenase n=1 Tax=Novipirellula artificiosorum TaxID=2528016 RepID=A0A5C6DSL1_9BACT|nr:aldo/keto reductase [Novipirellula artificiosorum]TWU39265.1 D-threo-aldose 1-dehydrogenase [Novipirellula artificiosorum]
MQRNALGNTGLSLSVLGFGASSIGGEFRPIEVGEALKCVNVALDRGINFIDTAAYYGRGLSECMLGQVLPSVPRDSYLISTKLGRYAPKHFDFSAKRVAESIDVSLERMKIECIDMVFCHDIEFVNLDLIVEETLPALRKEVEKGKVRYLGVSGYPMKIFTEMLERSELDVILTYNHYTLQNDMALRLVEPCKQKGVGLINAAPFSARLLCNAPLPDWHKATQEVRDITAKAAAYCEKQGTDIAKLALQYSVANDSFASCVTGSANPDRVAQWCDWIEEPLDEHLVADVKQILQPIHNWVYYEGHPDNSDD